MTLETHILRRVPSAALYLAAAAVAVGSAAIASQMTLPPQPISEPMLTMTEAQPVISDRTVAREVQPHAASLATASAVAEAAVAPPALAPGIAARNAAARDVARAAELARAPIPPKPVPRPCLDCGRPAARAAALPAAEEPARDAVIAGAAFQGPVPPLPVGVEQSGGADRPGFILRGGRAVVDGGAYIADTAWSISDATVGGLVRGVRRFAF